MPQNKSFAELIRDQAEFEVINRGGDQIAEKIYNAVPKPKTTGGKIMFGICTFVGAVLASQLLSDKDGKLSKSNRRAISSIHRGIVRRRIYEKNK